MVLIEQEQDPKKPPTAEDFNHAADELMAKIRAEGSAGQRHSITDEGEVAPNNSITTVGIFRQKAREAEGKFLED